MTTRLPLTDPARYCRSNRSVFTAHRFRLHRLITPFAHHLLNAQLMTPAAASATSRRMLSARTSGWPVPWAAVIENIAVSSDTGQFAAHRAPASSACFHGNDKPLRAATCLTISRKSFGFTSNTNADNPATSTTRSINSVVIKRLMVILNGPELILPLLAGYRALVAIFRIFIKAVVRSSSGQVALRFSAPINMPGRSASGSYRSRTPAQCNQTSLRIDTVRGDVHHQPQTRQRGTWPVQPAHQIFTGSVTDSSVTASASSPG